MARLGFRQALRRACYLTLAQAAQLLARRDFAMACYHRLLADAPRDAELLTRAALLEAEAGNRERAMVLLTDALAVAPAQADTWFNLGFLQQAAGDHARAIEAFERATALDARHDRAWYGMALSLIATGRGAQAEAPLVRNCELQPLSPHGRIELARLYLALDDRERCQRQIRELAQFDPRAAAQLEDETGIRVGVERRWQR